MENNYLVFVYIYDHDGFHRGRQPVRNKSELERKFRDAIKPAIEEGREVRITDEDDFLLFHAYGGHIKWDGRRSHVCPACIQPDDVQIGHDTTLSIN